MASAQTGPEEQGSALLSEVIALAWPALIQGLVVTGVLFTDRLLLGSHGGLTLGSMTISGPVIWSVFSVFGALGAGVLAVVGRAHGAGDPARAGRTASAAMVLGAVLGVFVTFIGIAFRQEIGLLVASSDPSAAAIRDLADRYMLIVFLSAPLSLVGAVGTVALQAGGDTRTPMFISVGTGIINLVLTWALLFGRWGFPAMGIDGAAIGTAVAFGFHGIATTVYLGFNRGPVRLHRPRTSALQPVIRVALPAVGEKVIFHVGYFMFVVLVGRLGDTAMIAHQALIAIESLGFVGSSAVGIAAGAIVAQKLGAKAPDEALRAGRLTAILGVICLSAVGVLFYVAAPQLVAWFTSDPNVTKVAVPCLRIAAFAQPLMALADAFAGGLRGAGDTKTPMIAALFGPVIVRLTACYVLAYWADLGLIGIWLGSTLDWLVRAVWLMGAFLRGRWRTIVLDAPPPR